MIDDAVSGVLIALAFLAIFMTGWAFAHNTVATECEKLGAFYVGNTVYKCEVTK